MDMTNMDYILDIFKTLSGELPDQMLYRENGDSMELRTLDDHRVGSSEDLMSNGWTLIGCHMAEAT